MKINIAKESNENITDKLYIVFDNGSFKTTNSKDYENIICAVCRDEKNYTISVEFFTEKIRAYDSEIKNLLVQIVNDNRKKEDEKALDINIDELLEHIDLLFILFKEIVINIDDEISKNLIKDIY